MTGMFLNEDYVSPEIVCKSLEITIDPTFRTSYCITRGYKRISV